MSHTFRPLALILPLVVAASLALGSLALAATTAVTIIDFHYSPSSVTVHTGDTVRWSNSGPSAHTATSDTGMWNSGTLAPGQSFSFTFNTSGTFAYHCTIHPFMTGTVVVQPVAPTVTPTPRVAPATTAPRAATTPAHLPNTSTSSDQTIAPIVFAVIVGLVAIALAVRRIIRI